MFISVRQKGTAVKAILEKKKTVVQVARELQVARKTVYAWVKRYQETPSRLKAQAFKPRYVRGKKHPRAVAPRSQYLLKKLIVVHPEWGARRLSVELKREGFDLGYFGVNEILVSLQASTFALRKEFQKQWSGPGRLKPYLKLEAVQKVIKEKVSVVKVAQEYAVARKTIYQWLEKYQMKTKEGFSSISALQEVYRRGKSHPRAVFPGVQKSLLVLVAKNPEWSVHRLAEQVPVSSWTVWKILKQRNLNYYPQRLAYAQAQAPIGQPFIRILDAFKSFTELFPSISPLAPPFRKKFVASLRPFAFSLLTSLIISNLSAYWLQIMIQAPSWGDRTGLLFAFMALLIGGFFFAYSMKYYFTLGLVLSFSRRASEEGGNYELKLSADFKNSNGQARLPAGQGWWKKIFGLGGPRYQTRPARSIGAGGLQPNGIRKPAAIFLVPARLVPAKRL